MRRSVLVKIWAGASAIGIAAILAVGAVSYSTVSHYLMGTIQESTVAFATVAAAKIDGDAFRNITPETGHDAAYDAVHACLSDFLGVGTIHFIYTLRLVGDRMQFVVDSDPEAPGEVGDDYEVQPGVIAAYREGRAYAIDEPYTDQWGEEYSGYAPIRDAAGDVVGVVAVDCSAASVEARLKALVGRIAAAGAICLLAAMAIGLALAWFIAKNLRHVNRKIVTLVDNGGDLTQRLDVRSGDEVQDIADNVNRLLGKLRSTIAGVAEVITHVNDVSGQISESVHGMGDRTAALCQGAAEVNGRVAALRAEAVATLDKTKAAAGALSHRVSQGAEAALQVDKIREFSERIINIAKQTNILSLNARVEAARAGEAGAGFAVVADEIGTLAATTTDSATQISAVLEVVLSAVRDLIESSQGLVTYVERDVMAGFDVFAHAGESAAEGGEAEAGGAEFSSFTRQISDMLIRTTGELAHAAEELQTFQGEVKAVADMSADNASGITALNKSLAEDYVY